MFLLGEHSQSGPFLKGAALEDMDETDAAFLLVTFGSRQKVSLNAVAQSVAAAAPEVVQQAQDSGSLHVYGVIPLRNELRQATGGSADMEAVSVP